MALNKDKIFKNADKYIRSNKIEKAINEYETWLKENPKDWNVVRQVGDLYSRIGRNDEAIKKYARVADHFKRDGFNVRAIATHKMILRLDAGNEAAMRNLAELQADEGLLMEAKSHYQSLVELYNKQGHKRRASEVFKKLTEIDPQDVKIRYKFAEFLNKQGKADEAAEEYVGIADQFISQGLVDEAIKILEQGRSLKTSDPILKTKLAHAHTLQGNHSQAVRLLEEVSVAHPNEPAVVAQLGEAYLSAGNTAEAERAFQKLEGIQPGSPENAIRLAELRIVQSKLDQALEQLTPLVDRRVAENDSDKAAALLSKVLSKDPYHVRTLLKLAEVHTILKKDSARVSAYDSLCEAYNRSGDFDKAVQVAEQLVELEPENAQHKDRLKFLKSKLGGAAPAVPASASQNTQSLPPPAPSGPEFESIPELHLDQDLPELGEVDLGSAVSDSFEEELALDEPMTTGAAAEASPAVRLGDMIELTQEDEENIKEKLTEAEVFVRYGLVDKAIAQLLDVLESFRYHIESREKLIEIYKDQGMTREASEQLLQMAQVYDQHARHDAGARAREEAAQLNPALAAETASAALAAQEELELTLAPETDSDLGEVGLEIDVAPVSAEVALPSQPVELPEEFSPEPTASPGVAGESGEAAPEIELSLDDSELPVSLDASGEDVAVDIDLGADVDIGSALEEAEGLEISLDGIADEDAVEEVSLSMDEAVPVVIESEEDVADLDEGLDADEIEIDLDAGSEDITFDIDALAEAEPEALEDAEEENVVSAIPEPAAPELASESSEAPASEIEASFDDTDAEAFVEIESEEELPIALSLPAEDDEADAIEIDIPSVDEIAVDEAAVDDAPAPPPPPPAAASAGPLAAALQEVDEYVALGLYEDARDTLRELLKQHPGEQAISAKLEELGFSPETVAGAQPSASRTAAPAVDEAPSSPPVDEPLAAALSDTGFDSVDDDIGIEALVDVPEPLVSAAGSPRAAASDDQFVDLASELSDEIFGTQSVIEEEEDEPEGPLTDPGLDQIFKEFRKGVEKQLGTEDYDTRYNLGIAYKEMGLLDEAIAEFQLAAKDELRNLECCSMLGLCFMEKGMPDIAIKWFSKGLALPGRREEEYHGLRYDLAQAHEAASQPDRALELYTEIFKENARFRDVKDRVRELQATLK